MIAQASIGGNGQVYDPNPGNQTGKELNIKPWYSRPWNCVLRHPDFTKAQKIAILQRDACKNPNIGYDWNRRTTYYTQLSKVNWNPSAITTRCDTDCSALTCANINACGHLTNDTRLASLGQLSTHSMRSALQQIGFNLLTDSRYLTSDQYLLPGDVLLNDGAHVAVNLDSGPKSGSTVIISNGEGSIEDGVSGGLLYDIENDEDDAILREVGYWTGSSPTKNATNYPLTVINYTTALGAFFAGFIATDGSSTGSSADVSGISNTVAKQTIQFLMSKGMNLAGACGCAGNIEHECGWNIAAEEKGPPYEGRGIVQWSFGRRVAMIRAVPDWKTNLTGQLNFLWGELSGAYRSRVLNPILAVPNTESGCREAAKIWCVYYEVPADRFNQAIRRGDTAVNNYFKKAATQL